MRRLLLLLLLVLVLGAGPARAEAEVALPSGFGVQTTVTGFSQPVGMAHAPDGRIFTVEKAGRLRVARGDGTLAPKLILDLSDHVNSYSDRGLLGVAVDRDFATNGWVYLLYVYDVNPLAPDGSSPTTSRLTRITVNPDSTVANPAAPETVILGSYGSGACPAPDNAVDCIPSDFYWHAIGSVRVDPTDGTLWLGSGDATGEQTQAQAYRTYDERSFAGKILHVDRNGRGLPGHPFCPGDADLTHVCTKLYAKGFRNPFRFTLRPGKGPVVGDVGYATREEIDLVKPGANYGWPCYEGDVRTPGYLNEARCAQEYAKEGTSEAASPPAYAYAHGAGASAVGGPLYSGSTYPADFRGDVLVGDYVQGWVKRLKVDAADRVTAVEPFATGLPAFVDLQQDPRGNLAYLDVGGFQAGQGAIRHIAYTGNGAPTARASATPSSGPAPLSVALKASASSDPEGDPLTYAWDFGDGSPGSGDADPTHVYAAGRHTARVTVSDGRGNRDTASVDVVAGAVDAPPTATITAPADGGAYRDGDRIDLRATGSDTEDGALPDSAYAWQVVLHHNTHLHEATSATGPQAAFATADDHDADAYYEIRLSVTDSAGNVTRRTATIKPKTVKLTLGSSPPGAPLTYAGRGAAPAPVSVQAAVGYRASIAAADTFGYQGRTYRFVRWSDGGARGHDVTVPDRDSALTAVYEAEGLQTLTFSPTADTWTEEATPNQVNGTSGVLVADADPRREALLRFAVSGVAGGKVVAARLRMHHIDDSPLGGRVARAAGSWSEATTTWANRPALEAASVGRFGETRPTEWYETDLAAGTVAGDGPLSLGLDSTDPDASRWSSRESAEPPQLVVEVAPSPATETLTFSPDADTYVNAAAPTTSKGTSGAVTVDADPAQQAYLRFGLTGLAGKRVVAAKLRLYQTDASPHGGDVSRVSSTTWTEGMTWNTRPPIDGPRLGAFGAVATNAWYETTLDPAAFTGDGPVALGLSSSDPDGSRWSTRETTNKPQLVLTVEPAPVRETLAFTPTADVWAASTTPSTSQGTSGVLVADADPPHQSYLRFRVAGVGARTVRGARLRMYQVDASPVGGRVSAMTASTWTEGMTWLTRPAIDGPLLATFGAVTTGRWYEVDLGAGAVRGDGDLNLGLDSVDPDSSRWSSRETANPPQLLLDVG